LHFVRSVINQEVKLRGSVYFGFQTGLYGREGVIIGIIKKFSLGNDFMRNFLTGDWQSVLFIKCSGHFVCVDVYRGN